jgi:hypothetical protein
LCGAAKALSDEQDAGPIDGRINRQRNRLSFSGP